MNLFVIQNEFLTNLLNLFVIQNEFEKLHNVMAMRIDFFAWENVMNIVWFIVVC